MWVYWVFTMLLLVKKGVYLTGEKTNVADNIRLRHDRLELVLHRIKYKHSQISEESYEALFEGIVAKWETKNLKEAGELSYNNLSRLLVKVGKQGRIVFVYRFIEFQLEVLTELSYDGS